ncbi:MAG TPA: thiamine ABC transporter substrate-binding protein [Acidimicrobiales bacterium]
MTRNARSRTATAGGPPVPRPLRRRARPALIAFAAVVTLALVGAACSSDSSEGSPDDTAVLGGAISEGTLPRFADGTTITVVTHDSFAVSDAVLEQFTEETGVAVRLLPSGDAVTVVNKAILTKDNPEGDVLFGIDENSLGRAFVASLFRPYEADGLRTVPSEYQVDDKHRVTPIDHGDVCVNYDREWFTSQDLPLPTGFDDLLQPALKDKLVVEDPSSSSPGLAFLLATIAEEGGGDDTSASAPWLQYWQKLKDNGVSVVDGWETAYYGSFSGGSGEGDRPLVVSYASSPPVEVTDPSIAADEAPTGVLADTCYRQTEFAGILKGTKQPKAAAAFLEFMLSLPFQEDVPGQMYVFPVNSQAQVPESWVKFTTPVPDPLSIGFREVGENQERWLQQWSTLFR